MTTNTIRHIVTGNGAPTSAPPGIGAHYVDSTSGQQYLAKGTSSPVDWIKVQEIPSGGHLGDVLTLTVDGPKWQHTDSGGQSGLTGIDVVLM